MHYLPGLGKKFPKLALWDHGHGRNQGVDEFLAIGIGKTGLLPDLIVVSSYFVKCVLRREELECRMEKDRSCA